MKKGAHTRRQLAQERRDRAAEAKAAERAIRTGAKRQDREARKVDAALRGCQDR